MTAITLPPLRYGSDPLAPIHIGVDDHGRPATLPVDEASWSVGGMTRAGKSVLLAGVIRQLAVRRDTAILLGDPKFVEFVGWHDRATNLALGDDAVRDQAHWVVAEVIRRFTTICDTRTWRVQRRITVGPDMPHIVWIVDECADVFAGKEGTRIVEPMARIMRMCLAAKVTPILCTQRSDVDAIPGKIRANLVYRVGFACENELHSRLTFGIGGVPAHQIPLTAKGVGFFTSDGERTARRFRSQLVTDAQIEEAAARTAPLRVDLAHLGLPHEYLSPILTKGGTP